MLLLLHFLILVSVASNYLQLIVSWGSARDEQWIKESIPIISEALCMCTLGPQNDKVSFKEQTQVAHKMRQWQKTITLLSSATKT